MADFIRSADNNASSRTSGSASKLANGIHSPKLLDHHPPKELERLLNFELPQHGQGLKGLESTARSIQKHSVNTWDQGFMDKLYHSPTPIGLAADLLLTSLNTNVHTFQVSPALTIIEKETTRALARMFGFNGPCAGGVSQSGGSAANQTSIIIARNTLFPETKSEGLGDKRFVLFTSAHGHYSLEKAAQISGFGSNAVRSIPVDPQGRMLPDALESAINESRRKGETAFYVNATAGTTVLGSFDPLIEIADVCQRHNLWLHVDASWGGPLIFSEKQKYKLKGIERADSLAMCPHKMMGVPLSCSLLLGKDLRQFHRAMTLPAGYLFHNNDEDAQTNGNSEHLANGEEPVEEFWDLADLTPQCGRRGDVLKLALSWQYFGTTGSAAYIDHAFEMAAHLTKLIASNPKLTLVSENPPPCLQVCFYFDKQSGPRCRERNSRITESIKRELLTKGFMIDYAPSDEDGKFFRVVVNGQTKEETLERLVEAIEEVGEAMALL